MDFNAQLALIAGLLSLTFMLNMPFGYFRVKQKIFIQMVPVHTHPNTFYIFARTMSHLDIRYIPLFVFAAIIGQVWGGKLEI